MILMDFAENGLFAPRKIASAFRTTSEEVARTVCLRKDAVQRRDRIVLDRTQRWLRETVEIVNKVEPRIGSPLMAYASYRSEPLAGYDGATAMRLLQDARAADVMEYVDGLEAGIHG